MSIFFDNHPVLSKPKVLRPLARGFGQVLRPFFMVLDATGALTTMQKQMNRRFDINDIYKPAFGDYQPDKNDVLVCTYTKSGTNWMLQMTYQIVQTRQRRLLHTFYDVVFLA